MKVTRALSQVLFRMLPEQTAELPGGVWKVDRWENPEHLHIDPELLTRRLLGRLGPWEDQGLDRGLADFLRSSGRPPVVVSPSPDDGVRVRRFPELFSCSTCRRVAKNDESACKCGSRRWIQERFVSFHECGAISTPWVPLCDEHRQARLNKPRGSRNVSEIRIDCPECHRVLSSTGFPRVRCQSCDDGAMTHQLHRAAIVYSPQGVAVVNPPTAELGRRAASDEARRRCLEWIFDGMPESSPFDSKESYRELVDTFVAKGYTREKAEKAAAALSDEDAPTAAAPTFRATEDAIDAAVELVFATSSGVTSLAETGRNTTYVEDCVRAMHALGLESVDLLNRFPVLTGTYGYTRAGGGPGESSLQWFGRRTGNLRVHGHLNEGEGLLFRLDPRAVASWLALHGHLIGSTTEPRAARELILDAAPPPPRPGGPASDAGEDLLTLLHSMAHRFIRRTSALAGIDRDSLSEYLVPQHLAFVVYASARGDFILGGLQALFENDLDLALSDVLRGESRCALDPGCSRDGGSCVACLHIGEPSCGWFNQYLDRRALFGDAGYLTISQRRASGAQG